MSRSLGHRLPEPLQELLHGGPADEGDAFVLATVDAAGRPHFALLSPSEVVAVAGDRLRLGTYSTSSTSANLRERSAFGLCLVASGDVYYVKGHTQELPGVAGHPGIARFEARVEDVLVDATRPEEGEAAVLSGIRFRRHGRSVPLGEMLRA